jgi:Ca2+/Na+ antiporter
MGTVSQRRSRIDSADCRNPRIASRSLNAINRPPQKRRHGSHFSREVYAMLWTIFVILLVLWLLGFIGFHAIGAYIHILLVIALVVLLIQLISGRRTV